LKSILLPAICVFNRNRLNRTRHKTRENAYLSAYSANHFQNEIILTFYLLYNYTFYTFHCKLLTVTLLTIFLLVMSVKSLLMK